MKHVLLIDDNEALLFALDKLCQPCSFLVDIASTKEGALRLLAHKVFDVVISDLNISGIASHEGFEIIRAAITSNPLVRTYIWTAYEGKELCAEALSYGMTGFLQKPVSFNTLLSIIDGTPVTEDILNGEARKY